MVHESAERLAALTCGSRRYGRPRSPRGHSGTLWQIQTHTSHDFWYYECTVHTTSISFCSDLRFVTFDGFRHRGRSAIYGSAVNTRVRRTLLTVCP